ncbi:hypothetical protein [Vitreimonas sp.]|uniref:hypothetical protein n=1 Tax=Vitreimonas sp. TaxID=3069702 RepID=UPI002ED98A82
MRKVIVRAAGVVAGAASLAGVANAEDAGSISEAIQNGELIAEARARYETFEQVGQNDADALTLRSRLGWQTGTWNGLSALVEFEDVRDLGGDYNDGIPPAEPYATIGDPPGTELNRLQLRWQINQHLNATIGRQYISFDDNRFLDVSNSRQDARTLDALRADFTLNGLKATYAYVDHVNNTTAEYNDWESASHLLNVSQTFSDAFKLTGFGYFFDFDEPASAINQSSQFLGVRATGKDIEALGLTWSYAASYAQQQDYGSSTVSFDLDYWQASVTAEYGEWSVQLWQETLEGDGARGFFTPLGSSNSFHGWAGAFISKPADGLVDRNVMLSYSPEWAPDFLEDLTFMVRYYDFEAERTDADFGEEWDFAVGADITDNLDFSIDYGDYESGDGPGSPMSRTRTRFVLQYRL